MTASGVNAEAAPNVGSRKNAQFAMDVDPLPKRYGDMYPQLLMPR
jgi:hypothetical protein